MERERSTGVSSSPSILTGLATGAVTIGKVTALDHELLDDTVEGRTLIAEALLASGEGAEVLSGLGDSLAVETNDDAAQRFIALLNVEVDFVGDLGPLDRLGRLGEERQADAEKGDVEEESPNIEIHG